ncbi:MAG: isoprenylcysteine carboxylmethyltransferase family protein [Chloroflexi bacterium]|nr:isoprenylcysteine carboxylmethyltransferase family protein [Chloroflexota bacterium]
MSASIISAIVVINAAELYYLISEIIMTSRTRQGTNDAFDRGTNRLVWILVVSAFIIAWLPVILDHGRLLVLGDWLTWVGVAIMISGIVFRQYAISVLGKFFTATVQIKKDHELIKAGPYRYIRHPSYLGILIISLGLGITLANWISLLVCIGLPVIGVMQRIKVEEKELERHFGKQYQDYKKNTWRIVPYIY